MVASGGSGGPSSCVGKRGSLAGATLNKGSQTSKRGKAQYVRLLLEASEWPESSALRLDPAVGVGSTLTDVCTCVK